MAVCKRVVVMVIILVAITMVTGIKSYREERNTDQQEKDPHYKGDEGKEGKLVLVLRGDIGEKLG